TSLERMGTMRARLILAALAVAGAVWLAGATSATGGGEKKTPSLGEMVGTVAQIGTPGPEHKQPGGLARHRRRRGKFFLAPGTPPNESEGTMQRKWIFDGRFLAEHYEGKAMGKPFKGLGLLGYDRQKKKYTNVWVDSMSTGIMTSLGTYDPQSK